MSQLWGDWHRQGCSQGLLLDPRLQLHPPGVPGQAEVHRGAGRSDVSWRGPRHQLLPVGHLHVLHPGQFPPQIRLNNTWYSSCKYPLNPQFKCKNPCGLSPPSGLLPPQRVNLKVAYKVQLPENMLEIECCWKVMVVTNSISRTLLVAQNLIRNPHKNRS